MSNNLPAEINKSLCEIINQYPSLSNEQKNELIFMVAKEAINMHLTGVKNIMENNNLQYTINNLINMALESKNAGIKFKGTHKTETSNSKTEITVKTKGILGF